MLRNINDIVKVDEIDEPIEAGENDFAFPSEKAMGKNGVVIL